MHHAVRLELCKRRGRGWQRVGWYFTETREYHGIPVYCRCSDFRSCGPSGCEKKGPDRGVLLVQPGRCQHTALALFQSTSFKLYKVYISLNESLGAYMAGPWVNGGHGSDLDWPPQNGYWGDISSY